MIQQERLGLGKGGIPGVHVVGDGLGGIHQLGVFRIQSLSGGVGALEDEAVAGIRGEGIGPGLGVGVVSAPVALHEGVVAGAADSAKETGLRTCLDDNVHVVGAQNVLNLLLHDLTLLRPVGGGGVVAHEHLDGEGGAGGGQLLNGGRLVFLGKSLVEVVAIGVGGQTFVVGVVLGSGGKGVGGDGVVLQGFGVDAVAGRQSGHPVEGVDDGLAEVLIVHGQLPVFGFVLGVEVGVKVEQIPVSVGGIGTGGVDQILGVGVSHHGGQQVGGNIRLINFAGLVHGGGDGGSLGVVGHLDGVKEHIVLIPVGGVLGQNALLLRLVGGQDKRAAVQQGAVVGAELAAAFSQERTVHGHIGAEGNHGQEVGAGGFQRELQGVVVQSLDADVVNGSLGDFLQDFLLAVLVGDELHGVAIFIGAVGGIGQSHLVCGPVIVSVGARDNAAHGIEGVGVVVGVTGVMGGRNPVIGGDGGNNLAVLIDPVHTLTDVEGPDGSVLILLPAGSQSRLYIAVGVVFHQAIHHVGGDVQLVGLAGDQIVQRSDFGSVQRSVNRVLGHGSRSGGCRGAVGGAGFAAAGCQREDHGQSQGEGEKSFHGLHSDHSFLVLCFDKRAGRKAAGGRPPNALFTRCFFLNISAKTAPGDSL